MSDDALVAALRMSRTLEGTTPVAALIARHGPSVSDYAEICASGSPALARALASTAFRNVVRDLQRAGSTDALRPRLLVTVRNTARARSQAGTGSGLSYDQAGSGSGSGSGDGFPPHSVTQNRHLSHVAFLRLPRTTQYVLWHLDVEAEPSTVPAALLGIEGDIPPFELDRAREQWRSALLRTHVENAAGRECRDYSRLLDASSRGVGTTLPEVQLHLDHCSYCQDTAEQLRLCATQPGVLLAEALLGESAHPYLAVCRARPSRTPSVATAVEGVDARPSDTSQTPRKPAGRRRAGVNRKGTKILVAVIAVGSAAVAAAYVVGGTSSDTTAPPPSTQRPTPTPSPSSPATSTALPVPPESGRLRNAAADLCMDVRGTPPKRGAEATLSACSAASTQQWTYVENGLLRNVAEPDLCLDAGGDDEVLDLELCDSSGDVSFGLRFELSPEGELLTRDKRNLVIAPAAPEIGTILVPSPRNGDAEQRWLVEPVQGTSTLQSGT
ncbi:RICIN domain-containing protein [Streptomyces deccanensis]|uniref:RICIN domain-containing protein n=1 Tax=Streptomyces deccanensis TaxID=424188 RepID=UPI001EFB3E58|nr:RICIN domain-containing protein [Streptomyces deccanensis]ULR55608.1 RICIN domain-containing protein [Streptomyces deccanensis]